MKITDFVSQIGKSGLARSNRYSVEMVIPSTTYSPNDYRKMLLFCDAVQLPGLNINTTENRTFGEVREMPYEFNYDPIQLSFYVDGDMIIKGIFDEWIQSIQKNNTRNFNYYKNYISDVVKITVEDLQDKPKYRVSLFEVYPKTIGIIQMGYAQKDIMKLDVTFAYKYWRSEVIKTAQPTQPAKAAPTQPKPAAQNYDTGVTSYTDAMGNVAFNSN